MSQSQSQVQSQSESNPLSPGPHLFTVPSKNLTLEYLVHPPSNQSPSPTNLLIIHCPAWGIGSEYLQSGLSPLRSPPNSPNPKSTSPSTDPPVSKTYTLLFFHPRGTANSTRPLPSPSSTTTSIPPEKQMSSTAHLPTDLDDLRKHLHLTSLPVLIGHSNGGAITLAYAQRYPSRVSKLILLNHQLLGCKDRRIHWDSENVSRDPRYRDAIACAVSRHQHRKRDRHARRDQRQHEHQHKREMMQSDEEFTKSVDEMWPVYFYDPSRYLGDFLDALEGGGNNNNNKGDKGKKKGRMSAWCYRAVYGCDEEEEAREPGRMVRGLKGVEAKTLVVFGQEDLICGVGIGRQTCQGIRDSRLLVYERCGHFPWIERGDTFFDDIREFLVS